MGPAALPRVAAIVPIRDADRDELAALLSDLGSQEGVRLELVLVDSTLEGDLELPPGAEATVVRSASPSRGLAYRRALEATAAPWIAWALPGAEHDPSRLRRQVAHLAAHPEHELVTSNLGVRAGSGRRLEQVCDVDAPPPLWQATVCLRREALARIGTTAFAPVELQLLRELRSRGAAGSVPAALSTVPGECQGAAAERALEDAELLRLREGPPHPGPPEVTVLLATHNRCETLLECLEGFARQLLPPGALEIVVVDDGSVDRTREVVRELELDVPFTFLEKEADGASRARILGLPHANGRLVLFVNDDTIPFPDTVRRHVEAHAELAGRKAMVLGTFEQPEEHLENGLMRLLERTHHVFGYSGMADGEVVPAEHFYTCHVSVPLAAVREVGGFDPDFSHYGCEDTDLGFRLEDAGYSLHYRAECRAIHRHFLDFEVLRRRQPLVARAHTRLFVKHPGRLLGGPWADCVRDELERELAPILPHMPELEAAGRTLSRVNLARLERLGGAVSETGRRLEERLEEIFPKLDAVWWKRGLVEGFGLHGIPGFPELSLSSPLELPELPRPITLLRPDPFLAVPWTEWVAAWLARDGARGGTLLLQAEPGITFEVPELQAAVAPVLRRARRDGARGRVAVVSVEAGVDPRRLLGSVDAYAALPTVLDGGMEHFLRATRLPVVDLDPLAADEAETPWPLATAATRRVLAWPDWRSTDVEDWLEALAPLAETPDLVLVLRCDLATEGDPTEALAALGEAFARRHPGSSLEVLLETAPLDERAWRRLRRAVDAVLLLPDPGGEHGARLRSLSLPALGSPAETASWLDAPTGAGDALPPFVEAREVAHA